MEIWNKTYFSEQYEISNFGRVRKFWKLKGYKIINPCLHPKTGYLWISFQKDKIRKNYHIHKLVSLAFIPNPNKLPQINHINTIKTDNRVTNLEWCTDRQNKQHAIKHNLYPIGSQRKASKLDENKVIEILKLNKSGIKNRTISSMFNISERQIRSIIHNDSWLHIDRSQI